MNVQESVVKEALSRVGKEFNPGVSAQCAVFVRHVLEECGIRLPITEKPWDNYLPTSYALANGLAGDDVGTQIAMKNLAPGDLVFFGGTYGGYPRNVITHIGVFVGDGLMVDRSTKSEPVRKRSALTTFTYPLYGCRPHAYKAEPIRVEKKIKVFFHDSKMAVVLSHDMKAGTYPLYSFEGEGKL